MIRGLLARPHRRPPVSDGSWAPEWLHDAQTLGYTDPQGREWVKPPYGKWELKPSSWPWLKDQR